MARSLLVAVAFAIATVFPANGTNAQEEYRYFPETGHFVKGDYLRYLDSHGGTDVLGFPRTEDFREGDRLVQYFQNVRLEWDCGENGRQPCVLRPGTLGEVIYGRKIDLPPDRLGQGYGRTDARYFQESNQTVEGAFLNAFDSLGGLEFFGYPLTDAIVESGQRVQWFQRGRLQTDGDGHPRLSPLGDFYIDTLKRVSPVYLVRRPAPAPSAPISIRAREPKGRFAFQTGFGSDIFIVNADGSDQRRLTDGAEPAISPDGTRVAFARWRDPAGIYLYDLTTGQEQLVVHGYLVRTPVWSPDGTRLAILKAKADPVLRIDPVSRRPRYALEDHWGVAIADLGSGSVTDLPSKVYSSSPTWSPDGRRIIFDGNDGLYLLDLFAETVEPIKISGTGVTHTQPAWSPDGSVVAFSLKRNDHWDIALIRPEGGGVRLVTDSPAYTRASNNVAAVWSPDGSQIAFLSDRDGSWQLYAADRDGSNVRAVFTRGVDFTFNYADERVVSWGR